MARGHGFECVVDFVFVACADAAVVHDLAVPVADGEGVEGWAADVEEMGTETSDKPFYEDLEYGSGDQGVEKADCGVVYVPETADADLADEEDDDGHEDGEHGCGPDGDDFVTEGVGELGVDNFAVLKCDRKATTRCWLCHVYTQADGTHYSHAHDV